MSNCYLTTILIFYCFYLFRSSILINGVRVIKKPASNANRPILQDFTGGQLEQALDEATLDDDDDDDDDEVTDLSRDGLEDELREASRDDGHVPSSLSNSIFPSPEMDDFENLMSSLSVAPKDDSPMPNLQLNRVADGEIPSGIDVRNYGDDEADTLVRLYQSDRPDDRKTLFQFIAVHTHNKLLNCAMNFGRWMKNPRFDEPVFFRNCVPCTNTVDLNFQSLFNNYLQLQKLKYYYVNTCDMSQQWISYVSDMEYVSINLKRHPTATFTDVIRQNLLPNYRYVFQGLVRSEIGRNQREFFHACNLIHDELGHIWIIDGQIERVFDFNDPNDIKELDQRYRPDYITRASTGLLFPPSLIKRSQTNI